MPRKRWLRLDARRGVALEGCMRLLPRYWAEGCEHKKVIGTQLQIPTVPDEWWKDAEWREWLAEVKKLRDSLRCAHCYATTPKEGHRAMMVCSRCKRVRRVWQCLSVR